MDKVVKSLFRTLLVCGILTVGFSVTSISSQAAGNQSEAQVNADINGGVENSEEYQQILADIAKLEEEIAGYEKALEQVKSDYEFFLMRVGLEEDFVETYEGYEKAKSELMDKFGKLHEREFELEEKYEELKIKYRELFASENADEAELQALQDEMDIIDAERKEISKRLDEVYEEYERISDIEDYVTRGLNIDEYYRYIQTYRDQI